MKAHCRQYFRAILPAIFKRAVRRPVRPIPTRNLNNTARYVLDRFRLIDWTRTDPRSDNPVANESHLHERQPGALIFRSQEGDQILLEVVLLALATPTSGVHRAAMRNGIRFIRAWNQCTGVTFNESDLRVRGPTFSGPSLSMALTLNDAPDHLSDAFGAMRVVRGSATVDTNVEIFRTFAPAAIFAARSSADIRDASDHVDVLEHMNPAWQQGAGVDFLLPSNTAYGQTPREYGKKSDDPFDRASVFYFPLHVSQLRNDAPAAPTSAVTVLPHTGRAAEHARDDDARHSYLGGVSQE